MVGLGTIQGHCAMIEFQVVLGIHRASRPASLAGRSGSDGQAAESAAQTPPWGRLEDIQKSPQRTSGFPWGYQIHGLSPYRRRINAKVAGQI